MAKQRHEETQRSSTSSLIILGIGAVLVAGLIVWALTRTVEPTRVPVADTAMPAPMQPSTAVSTAAPAAETAPLSNAASNDRASIPRIAPEDLRESLSAGEVTVIDVRDQRAFDAGHIPGSMHIPLASVQANLDRLPKDKPIVTYCT